MKESGDEMESGDEDEGVRRRRRQETKMKESGDEMKESGDEDEGVRRRDGVRRRRSQETKMKRTTRRAPRSLASRRSHPSGHGSAVRIQFSSAVRFLGGPGMLSSTSLASEDFLMMTSFSRSAVCIRRTLNWFLRGDERRRRQAGSRKRRSPKACGADRPGRRDETLIRTRVRLSARVRVGRDANGGASRGLLYLQVLPLAAAWQGEKHTSVTTQLGIMRSVFPFQVLQKQTAQNVQSLFFRRTSTALSGTGRTVAVTTGRRLKALTASC